MCISIDRVIVLPYNGAGAEPNITIKGGLPVRLILTGALPLPGELVLSIAPPPLQQGSQQTALLSLAVAH